MSEGRGDPPRTVTDTAAPSIIFLKNVFIWTFRPFFSETS